VVEAHARADHGAGAVRSQATAQGDRSGYPRRPGLAPSASPRAREVARRFLGFPLPGKDIRRGEPVERFERIEGIQPTRVEPRRVLLRGLEANDIQVEELRFHRPGRGGLPRQGVHPHEVEREALRSQELLHPLRFLPIQVVGIVGIF
jgi:hypothetical protein